MTYSGQNINKDKNRFQEPRRGREKYSSKDKQMQNQIMRSAEKLDLKARVIDINSDESFDNGLHMGNVSYILDEDIQVTCKCGGTMSTCQGKNCPAHGDAEDNKKQGGDVL